eukprot:2504002-Prymnesium_polylepis.1
MPLLLAEAAHVHTWPQTIQRGDRSAGRPDTRSARSRPTGRPASRSQPMLDELPDAQVDALTGRTKEGATPRLPCRT